MSSRPEQVSDGEAGDAVENPLHKTESPPVDEHESNGTEPFQLESPLDAGSLAAIAKNVSKLEQRVENLVDEKTQQKKTNEALHDKLAKQATLIAGNTAAQNELQSTVSFIKEEMSELKDQCEKLTQEKQELLEQLEVKNEAIDKLTEEKKVLETERDQEKIRSDQEKESKDKISSQLKTVVGKLNLETNSKNELECIIRKTKKDLKCVEEKYRASVSCAVCIEIYIRPLISECGHVLCFDCWKRILANKYKCPQCKEEPGTLRLIKSYSADIDQVVQSLPVEDQTEWKKREEAANRPEEEGAVGGTDAGINGNAPQRDEDEHYDSESDNSWW